VAVSVAIHDGPLPAALCAPSRVIAPGRGAVSSFLGVVRDHAKGRAVSGLYYECYRPMAERVLATLGAEAAAKFDPALEVFVAHGTGAMAPGEVSVCILAASAHRGPACDAARHLIERIKQDLPVWKKQTFADGEIEWVQGS
jgi:molybdopterin synthase catalytic subunit